MNNWGASGIPFLFVFDFEGEKPLLYPLDKVPSHIQFSLPMMEGEKNAPNSLTKEVKFQQHPITEAEYGKAYERVQYHLHRGDTYLLNLTMPTPIDLNLTLKEVFESSKAPYRLLIEGELVCFSPEIFVRIKDGVISSYPMKGTIDADLPNAAEQLLNDKKETAEHNTIVDLIRNDLSMVAKKVRVTRYRYLDEICTNTGRLLQLSSEISGRLPDDYTSQIGDVIARLLPAGSISGAPKEKTLEVIREAEKGSRGYYTGIFGVFDGKNVDSAVMIRYIEKQNGQLTYRSGGGITAQSNCTSEYNELIRKVYVPIT
ncbi:aminodeoxychorismate synthase component I [Prolixibacteraceae bacterium JC049]|nr:aminodeoxychorismate synthase component I [Prolixibacteraceae bacterium JC049]